MCGDPCDSMTEEKLILFERMGPLEEDSERRNFFRPRPTRKQTVRERVYKCMLRKVTYSAANGHLRTGGGYLTIEEYAEAMTNRVMKARKKRHNG